MLQICSQDSKQLYQLEICVVKDNRELLKVPASGYSLRYLWQNFVFFSFINLLNWKFLTEGEFRRFVLHCSFFVRYIFQIPVFNISTIFFNVFFGTLNKCLLQSVLATVIHIHGYICFYIKNLILWRFLL